MKENIIVKWSLILSIVIISNLFFNYLLSLTFNSPDFDEFCPFEKTSKIIETKDECEKSDGIWNPSPSATKEAQVVGYCDLNSKCSNEYQKVEKVYEQKVFIALVVIGILVLIISLFIKNNTVLSYAFSITAVLDFVIASIRYWQYSDKLLKVGILFIALMILIYLAIKKFNKLS